MEDQSNFLLDWSFFSRGKSVEELTQSLLITTMELEAARFKALEELKLKDTELTQLKHLLQTAINEKLEAQNRYQTLLHHRQTTAPPPPHSVHSASTDDHVSDCDESIVSSSITEPPVHFTPPEISPENHELRVPAKKLPENGKFLEAVVKAGPLLQNLLLAGPLPHWRHPPPALETYQIPTPPVVVPAVNRLLWKVEKKRGFPEGSDCSVENKCQRLRDS
ncbi:hypothetical protein HanIR_Chr11g0548031 [Helianthus annuus]|nr:hypothetical protein HanIR_Chr11g0548031 [Helianthus annuus]